MRSAAFVALALACASCTCSPGGSDGGPLDAGTDGGRLPCQINAFDFVTLDTSVADTFQTAMAVGPGDRVGFAYFVAGDGGVTVDGGLVFPNSDLRYVEWSPSAGASPPQTVVSVQVKFGVSVAFQSNGQPVVAYLGGPNKTLGYGGVPVGANPFWLQQNAVLNYRQADGATWKEVLVDDYTENVLPTNHGNNAPCLYNGTGPNNNPTGMVLGLWPALLTDGAGNAYLAYRDVGQAAFTQNFDSSNLKIAVVPAAYAAANHTTSFCADPTNPCQGIAWGDSNHGSMPGYGTYGGQNNIAFGPGGLPAVASDQIQGAAGGLADDVLFFQATGAQAWTCFAADSGCFVNTPTPWSLPYCGGTPPLVTQVANVGDGPSLAWSSPDAGGDGFGIAYNDEGNGTLVYASSPDGVAAWNLDTALGQGTGGGDPSLVFDTDLNPNISFHMCAAATGATSCDQPSTNPNGSNVQVACRLGTEWQFGIVDKDGFFQTHLGLLSTHHRVLTYLLGDKTPRLAVER